MRHHVSALPQTLIFDFASELSDFYNQLRLCKEHDYEWCIDELLKELTRYLEDAKTASDGLEALRTDVALYKDYFGSDEAIEPAVSQLAKALLWHFQTLGLYSHHGELMYRLSNYWPDTNSPVLTLRETTG